jgi:SpoVK/Ycf46/Vps4 family AAA+-type ATPase
VPLFLREKRDAIRRSGSLTYVEPEPPDRFAGYPALTRLLERVAASFTPEARAYGLPREKGILLVGLPGCGKDLCKRVAAAVLGLPLLDLDFAAVMGARGGVVGQAHQEVRQALQIAETVRCILGVTEFEKALGGLASSNASDGGETARTIGSFLAWMADQEEVLVFATANDVRALAPEQIRHGRFDHVLFVDLPRPAARREILAVHLRRVGRAPEAFDLAALAELTAGFSGAELAAAVKEGLALAFAAGREVDTVDLVRAARGIRPLSAVRAEEIEALRAWARGHGIASADGEEDEARPAPAARTVEL